MTLTGSLETIDGRPVLRFDRRLGHPVERAPHVIAYEWGGEQFRFELQPDGDG